MDTTTYQLSDLVTIKYGKNQKKVADENGNIPIYGTGGLMGFATQALYDKPSVLIGRKGSIDKVKYVDHPFWTVDTLFYTIVNEDIVIPKYLYYLMSLMDMKQYNEGTTIPSLRTETLNRIELEIPPIDDQKKVLECLNPIDAKITNNEAINRNLTEQFRAIVDDFVENLEDYRLMRLDEVAECQNGHAFYKDGYDESGAFVIDLGNVNTSANFVYTNADKYISMDRYEQSKLEKYHVFKDDLVMVMTDRKSTMDLLGKTGKVYKDGYYLLNQRMYRIRAKDNINVNYLYAILNSSKVNNSLKEKALGSVQKYVNTKEINEIEIMLPTPDKMEELAQVVNPISSKMETNILENENLHNLRDELLPKLMSGELNVSDLDI